MPSYPRSIYGTHSRSYAVLVGIAAVYVLITALAPLAAGDYFSAALYLAGGIALSVFALRAGRDRRQREETYLGGVELEAEILARYEAGALVGSDLWKARQVLMSAEDARELKLRYSCDGREIVSRGQVPADIFFRSRGLKTLKIKTLPDRPEDWVALG